MLEFTKKHFQNISDIIREVTAKKVKMAERMRTASLPFFDMNLELCSEFSDFLEGTNPKFDRNKFMDACVFKK
ncbi:MAG: hypothetical protein ACP5D2_04085 [Candidatus Nanoarchaeia archaeon]